MDTNIFKKEYFVIFLTHHLYYIPQFLPVARELQKRDLTFLFLLMGNDSPAKNEIARDVCNQNGFPCHFYNITDPTFTSLFMINGANSFPTINLNYKYSASIVHGIGTKAGYYTEEQNKHDIRFVEGAQRVEMIQKLFPDTKCQLFNVGFAKLDAAFSISETDRKDMVTSFNLSPERKTILYAPTFYPSSIDKMPADFPSDFSDYNIIIKPHFFSFEKKTYRHHLRKFEKWATYPNVYMASAVDFNLVPFMTVADLMISDESSAIFEFAALNKPVIINRNVKFRLTYRLFKSKIRKRMDAQMDPFKEVATPIHEYEQLKLAVSKELKYPEAKEKDRKRICEQIVGLVDGKVSERIVDIMASMQKKKVRV